MPERSSVAQVSQIGVEATPGTAVAATKRLGSMSFDPTLQTEVETFRPAGVKFTTVLAPNREWADVSVDGAPTYEEVVYPLAGALGTPTVSEVMDGATATGAYEWVFTPSSTVADAPKTFTLERGDSVQAERFAHVLLAAFGLEITRAGVSMSGSGFAKRVETGVTPTPGLDLPTDLTPIMPGQFSVYLADTQAALSSGGSSDPTKRLTRLISAAPSVEDRYNPAWFVNSAEDSFATFTENADGVGGTTGIRVEADAAGMAWLDKLRAGTTHFLRLEAEGPVLYNAGVMPNLKALFQWDMAFKVEGSDTFGDEDGIYAIGWTLRPVHDETWGKAMSVKVRNTVAAL